MDMVNSDDGDGSTQVSTSPVTQGRSVRDMEEQMNNLRKENFNLKLRLYLMEESIPGYRQQANSGDSQETIIKQLIDSKVEIENLRKEVMEKQEVLKEAAQAMTQMEQIQKDTETKCQIMVDELSQKLQNMEMERTELSENKNALHKIRELNDVLRKCDQAIKEYENKVIELSIQNADLSNTLESKENEIIVLERRVCGLRLTNADLKEDNQNLIAALKLTQENFRKEMSNMKLYEKQMHEQQDTLSKMQSTITIKTANTARLLDRIQDYEKMVNKMNFERNLAKRENRFFRTIITKLQQQQHQQQQQQQLTNKKHNYNINNNNNNNSSMDNTNTTTTKTTTTTSDCYTIEKEEVYQQFESTVGIATGGQEYEKSPFMLMLSTKKHYDTNYNEMKARETMTNAQPSATGYKLKHKLCMHFCNGDFSLLHDCSSAGDSGGRVINIDNIDGITEINDLDDDDDDDANVIPIRYTISDGSLFTSAKSINGVGVQSHGIIRASAAAGGGGADCGAGGGAGGDADCDGISRASSCSSLHANYSNASIFSNTYKDLTSSMGGDGGRPHGDLFIKEQLPPSSQQQLAQHRNKYSAAVDGIRYVYPKF